LCNQWQWLVIFFQIHQLGGAPPENIHRNGEFSLQIHHFAESRFGRSGVFGIFFGGSKLLNLNLKNLDPYKTCLIDHDESYNFEINFIFI
jgi:hypothetical protein